MALKKGFNRCSPIGLWRRQPPLGGNHLYVITAEPVQFVNINLGVNQSVFAEIHQSVLAR